MQTEKMSDKVVEIIKYCLFRDSELQDGKPPLNAVICEGVRDQMGFHPGRLEEKRSEIVELAKMLPEQFELKNGGGWSFLNLCTTKDGEQWTDLQSRCDEFFLLMNAVGIAKFLAPRMMWHILPGGMPYIGIDLGATK